MVDTNERLSRLLDGYWKKNVKCKSFSITIKLFSCFTSHTKKNRVSALLSINVSQRKCQITFCTDECIFFHSIPCCMLQQQQKINMFIACCLSVNIFPFVNERWCDKCVHTSASIGNIYMTKRGKITSTLKYNFSEVKRK